MNFSTWIDFLVNPYYQYSTSQIIAEFLAVIFGIWSVLLAKKNHVGVFPTGMINSGLYIWLLFQWSLFGDMLINIFYFIMSIYGWYVWKFNKTNGESLNITFMQPNDKKYVIAIFIISFIFVTAVYLYFDKYYFWWVYLDTFITALFFVGMWLLAHRKIENWIFLLMGNIVAIPLFFIKGFALTGFLFIFLSIIAVTGYQSWRKLTNQYIK